ncbi:hypothetical protein DFQ27_004805 [Actinomortierella ambigua]|uniref:Bacteriophage T5 Orf172 DNA-binding domain-containing protein n=1 Tax=Actinomortierella ambigua TaxID=1343610 RepID=A0A9P6U2U2_9FUNG|nr:hypothetical protein DFQ27_004805 [Actinomortierella ambigua]
MPNTRSPSPDTAGSSASQCKAIAISTGQRCTRSGKNDGYCSEKHKQQAEATGNFWGHRADGGNPFSESEASEPEKTAAAGTTTAKVKKAATTTAKKTSKVKAAVKSKLSRGGGSEDDDDAESKDTNEGSDSAIAAPKKATPTRAKKPAAAKKSTAAVAAATKKKPTTKGRGKASQDSEDDYAPSEESDGDFEPEDIVESSDDDDDDEEDDGVDELAESLKSVRIQKDDPSLPPRPPASKKTVGAKKGPKSNIQPQGPETSGVGKFLAPPKKVAQEAAKKTGKPAGGAATTTTTTTTTTTKPKHRGFWIVAPPNVDIPESTIKILSTVREKLHRDDSFGSVSSGTDQSSSSSFDGFKYHAHVPKFLQPQVNEDPDSKRAKLRQLAAKFWTKLSSKDDDDVVQHSSESGKTSAADKKDLPPILAPAPAVEDQATKKKKSPQAKAKPSSTSRQRRGSSASVDSVDDLTKDVKALTVKGDSGDDVEDDDSSTLSNQCHGYNTNGQRCKRRVKVDGPIRKNMVLMCHNHEVDDDQAAVHIEGKGGVLLQWVDISAWVNPNLPDFIQIKLRRTMEKPISTGDKPGYIYAYHLKGASSDGGHTFFKVGRTDNVYRRMAQWSDQCGTPPRLLEVFPDQGSLAPRNDDDLDDDDEETAKTKAVSKDVVTGLRCRYAHRIEHLIHIELKPYHDKDHVCVCKTNHREWFKVPHKSGLSHSEQQKHAWQQVRRIIVHWMAYMDHVYGPG